MLAAALGAAGAASAPAPARAQTIDRLVAVVGGQVLTESDLRAALALGLLPAPGQSSAPTVPPTPAAGGVVVPEPGAAFPRDVLDRAIDRELMRAEVERFGVTDLSTEDVDRRVAAIRARFPGPQAFTDALARVGMTEARLRAWLSDDLRIQRYIAERFEPAAQPTDEDVLQYYQSREREFLLDGRPRPFEDVQTEVRERLLDERRRTLVAEWVAGLRRRAEIVIRPPR